MTLRVLVSTLLPLSFLMSTPHAEAAGDARWEVGLPAFHVTSDKLETEKDPKAADALTSKETDAKLNYGTIYFILEPTVFFGDHMISTLLYNVREYPFVYGMTYGYQIADQLWIGPAITLSSSKTKSTLSNRSFSTGSSTDERESQNTRLLLNVTKRVDFESSGYLQGGLRQDI